jgi:general stress protein CsbA
MRNIIEIVVFIIILIVVFKLLKGLFYVALALGAAYVAWSLWKKYIKR